MDSSTILNSYNKYKNYNETSHLCAILVRYQYNSSNH